MEDKAKIERCKYSHPHFKDINNTWYVKLLQSMDQPEEE